MVEKVRSKAPTKRQLKVGEELRHALSNIINRGSFIDPILESVSVTITEVRISPDLRKAKVFVVPLAFGKKVVLDNDKPSDALGVHYNVEDIIAALTENQKKIRFSLGNTIHLKFTPELRFLADEGYAYSAKIDSLLKPSEIKKDV